MSTNAASSRFLRKVMRLKGFLNGPYNTCLPPIDHRQVYMIPAANSPSPLNAAAVQTAVASFPPVPADFERVTRLTAGGAFAVLDQLAVIDAAGADAGAFLHTQLSNDVETLDS